MHTKGPVVLCLVKHHINVNDILLWPSVWIIEVALYNLHLSTSFPGPLSAFQHWGKGGGWLEMRLYIYYREINK